MFQTLLAISGMRDNRCRERLLEAIGGVEGVTDVRLSLIRGYAEIMHDSACDPARLIQAVVGAGYVAHRLSTVTEGFFHPGQTRPRSQP